MIHVPSLVVLGQAAEPASRIPLYIIMVYMCLLFALGWISSRLFRGSSKDFFCRKPINWSIYALNECLWHNNDSICFGRFYGKGV
jgi:hypothetical protein